MAAARRKIRPEDIHGLKYFKALQGLIERLHFVGTQRDKAGNRDLHGGKTVPNTTRTQLFYLPRFRPSGPRRTHSVRLFPSPKQSLKRGSLNRSLVLRGPSPLAATR